MADGHCEIAGAHGPRPLDKWHLAQHQEFTADVLSYLGPPDRRQCDDKNGQSSADVQRKDQNHAADQHRDRGDHADEPHDRLVGEPAFVPAGDGAEGQAEDHPHHGDKGAGDQGGARAVQEHAVNIVPPFIGAELIFSRGGQRGADPCIRLRIVMGDDVLAGDVWVSGRPERTKKDD